MPYYLILHVLKTFTLNDEKQNISVFKNLFLKCMVIKRADFHDTSMYFVRSND